MPAICKCAPVAEVLDGVWVDDNAHRGVLRAASATEAASGTEAGHIHKGCATCGRDLKWRDGWMCVGCAGAAFLCECAPLKDVQEDAVTAGAPGSTPVPTLSRLAPYVASCDACGVTMGLHLVQPGERHGQLNGGDCDGTWRRLAYVVPGADTGNAGGGGGPVETSSATAVEEWPEYRALVAALEFESGEDDGAAVLHAFARFLMAVRRVQEGQEAALRECARLREELERTRRLSSDEIQRMRARLATAVAGAPVSEATALECWEAEGGAPAREALFQGTRRKLS